MKAYKLMVVASLGLLTLAACDADGDGSGRVAVSGGDSAAIDQIAGDKNTVVQVMRRAHDRGTLDDAMALAMEDSSMAAALAEIVRGDSRFVVSATPSADPVASPSAQPRQSTSRSSGSNTKVTTTSGTTTTPRKGDILDQTERTAQKVNERLEQAERVKREAADAKRKVEDILGRKP